MEHENGDMELSHGPSAVENQAPLPAPPGYRPCLVVLGAGCISLTFAVIVLSRVVSHLASEKGQTSAAPGSNGAGSGDTATPPGSGDLSTAACSACLELFRSQLIQSLCHPTKLNPAGGAGCKLCPTDWWLRGDKCYWVSRESKTWNKSRSDCAVRGSQLLVMQDQEELEALKHLTQGRAQFWVGLSRPSPEKAWTWLDGSQLDQTWFPVSGPAEGSSCGAVKGNRIHSQSCSSALPWICQRDAVLL